MRAVRVALIAALLFPGAVVAVGCSGPSNAGGAAPKPTSSASGAPSRSASPTANPFGSASPTPFAEATSRARPCDPAVQYSINSGVPGGTYIRAGTRPSIHWGPKCEVLSAGDKCVVEWEGAYSLAVGTEAHLRFQAWARGQSKPFKELTAGPLPPENSFRRAGFPVTLPKGVKEVSFRIVLLDTAKTPVAISDAFSYLLDCKPEIS